MKKEENFDIPDVLLGQDNTDPITLCDENGTTCEFEQIAIIPHEEDLYVFLRPMRPYCGVETDETILFKVGVDDDGDNSLFVEDDMESVRELYDLYLKMPDEAN